ncbi:MAG: elongation factor P maturation arginine rhamnosyltransferase EarP [Pseudomonadota bacterium]
MTAPAWDIFCAVIDNYGDIGVCWRLAHILRHDHGQSVRLIVDDLDALKLLVPAAQSSARQELHGIDVRHWTTDFPEVSPADAVIEAFGCALPASYVQAMRARTQHQAQPMWINLEYMSCEDWVPGVHGQISMLAHGLKKRFFIPSLLPGCGGLLREKNLLAERSAFITPPERQKAWCAQWNIPLPSASSLTLSLFAYENARLGALLTSLSHAPRAVTAYLPQSRLLNSLRATLNRPELQAGDTLQLGNLQLHIIPFLPQAEYDRLLWLCDINFVRGEESLTRALWAGKPFIWQIYPTDDQAHHAKLEAFLHAYAADETAEHLAHLHALMRDWNHIPDVCVAEFYASLLALQAACAWYTRRMEQVAQRPELTQQLLAWANRAQNQVAIPPPTGYNAAPK